MKKELLFSVTKDDFDIQTFRSGGKGGQHQNKTESGVRIIHRASGAIGESRSERSQHQNKKLAFKHLLETKKWKIWHKLECAARLQGIVDIQRKVDEMMKEENLKIEYF
jgi:protein subunit release factor B